MTTKEPHIETMNLARAIRRRRPSSWLWWLGILFLLILTLLAIAPLFWMIIRSFAPATPTDLMRFPTLDSWQNMLRFFAPLRGLLNSFIVASCISFGATISAAMAGYAFGKKQFPGQTVLFWLLLVTMMLPLQISLIPLFVLMKELKWFDTYQALILPYWAYPFGVFLMKQFMRTIPNDLIDAAKIDGAGELQVFWRIILPLAKPAVGAMAIFAFMAGWNEYWWQLVMISTDKMMTIIVDIGHIAAFGAATHPWIAAGSTLSFIPLLIIFLAFQGHFVQGLTTGAVKG